MTRAKKEDDTFQWKKQKKNQNSVIIMIPVVGKRAVFPVKLKLEGEIFE